MIAIDPRPHKNDTKTEKRGRKTMDGGCSNTPGDPASWPLNQREEQSAKIVFEVSLEERVSLRHLSGPAFLQRRESFASVKRRRKDSNLNTVG